MKQVFIQGGAAVLHDVPAPALGPKNVLVATRYSCISVGTELASVRMSALPLYRRALKQPQNVKRVVDMAREQGISYTIDRLRGKLSVGSPVGYSAAGTVIALGEDVEGFQVGDEVACVGVGYANHAEILDVPVNLVCLRPAAAAADAASTVALGCIALQGIRRAAPTLGETVVVYGLGALGQLATQMLRAHGCRTIGIDLDPERMAMAKRHGLEHAISPQDGDPVQRITDLTDGYGADAVIITAATSSSEIMSIALRACRRKGRVVIVGDVGLDLNRADFYAKEIDVLISASYGPGRYDPNYEEGGQDYPIAYIRWTEQRNMQEYLRLLATGAVDLNDLGLRSYLIDHVAQAYADLQQGDPKPLLAVLEYPDRSGKLARRVDLTTPRGAARSGVLNVGVVGAGSFAQAVHIPNMNRLSQHFRLHALCGRTGASLEGVALLNKAAYVTTDYDELLRDPDVHLVLIATRHHLHAPQVLKALRAGKHVMVEKPLALNEADLAAIEAFYRANPGGPVLLTGFNRRFSPAARAAKAALAGRATPIMLNYRMNAGYLPADHWTQGQEGGGRNIGEACHIYDLFEFLVGARPVGVSARGVRPQGVALAANENFVATISYEDGSVCSLTYTSLGCRAYPKEQFELSFDRKTMVMTDYRELVVHGGTGGWKGRSVDKGHLAELEELAATLSAGSEWPIALESQIATTRVSFEVEAQLSQA